MKRNFLVLIIISFSSILYGNIYKTDSLSTIILNNSCCKNEVLHIEELTKSLSDSLYQNCNEKLLAEIEKLDKEEDKIQFAKYHYFKGYRSYTVIDDVDALKEFLKGISFLPAKGPGYLSYSLNLYVAASYSRLAFYSFAESFSSKAMLYYRIAEKEITKVEGANNELIRLYNLMGHCAYGLKDSVLAEELYMKSQRLGQACNNRKAVVNSILNRGDLYHRFNQVEKAEALSFEALSMSDSLDYVKGRLYALLNLSQIQNTKCNYELGIAYAKRAIKEACSAENDYIRYKASLEAAYIYGRMGEFEQAVKYMETNLENPVCFNNRHYYKTVLNFLISAYSKQGGNDKAKIYKEKYDELDQEFVKEDYEKKVKLAESLLAFESTVFENKLLDNENRLQELELTKSRHINLFGIIILILLGLLTFGQRVAKKRYKSQALKIKEQNDLITSQNHEIITQNEELHKYKVNLERLVEERTFDLREALNKAQESNRLKSAFLQNVLHEIRTPANAIHGFAQIVHNQDEETISQNVDIVMKGSADLIQTVDKIIKVAKQEADYDPIELKPYASKEFNEQFTDLITDYILKLNQSPDVSWELKLVDFGDVIVTDFQKVFRCVSYLIDNAFKFSDQGKIRITTIDNGKNLNVVVADEGIGIANDDIEAIFDLFHKVDNPKRLSRGIGLGLVIANQLIKTLKGEIHVQSVLGKGTSFVVSLPKEY